MNVFDFDNTVYDGETLVDFILYYVLHDIKIWRFIPKLLFIWLKDSLHLFTVEEAVEAYAGFLEGYYVHIKTLDEDTVKFWNSHEKKIKPFYEKIRRDDDVFVTGTTDFIFDEIARRMGIKNYITSAVDRKTGKFTRLCFLENKVKLFREAYPDAEIENFYTDSMNDKSMMDISKNVYLVKGKKITKIK
ncbi:MAG: haloacid dehalogenase-like hydrolase [Faecalibacterium sp.]|nr:haloacid dehalogenase-like hydrolase [Ruminococcus sp.]MCM1392921.1 haloacid dehalogenase-like hydrolase [Ruminococcus sp.]MCM1486161.1 haloacid dehalogenase-like hydrolase [Faecalibacterium sp.]